MGGSRSKATVLENMIKNFKKGFDGDYGRKMTPGQLCTLGEIEWPSVVVGWPLEGTMDLNFIKAVYAIINGKAWIPQSVPVHRLLAGNSPRPPQNGPVFMLMVGKEKS